MKKILLIPFLMLFLVSCSEEDSAALVNNPPQSTTWKIHEKKLNGVVQSFGPCNVNDKMTLNSDGTGVIQGYYQNDAEECLASDPVNFTYEINEQLGTFTIDYMSNGLHNHYVEDILMYNGEYLTIDTSARMAGADSGNELITTYKKV